MRKVRWLCAGVLLALMGYGYWRWSLPRGTIETVECSYHSVGDRRKMVVHLPPGYPQDAPYPVLYLLHGAGDDESAWLKKGSAKSVLDNLYAGRKAVPMIVVMPNAQGRGSAFGHDLIGDVIPYVDSHYPVRGDRISRAIAGVSMGGGQALSIGLAHLDTFAWIAGFSSSLANRKESDLFSEPDEMRSKLKLLWISCGDADGLMAINKSLHEALERMKVPHVWHIGSGEHEWSVWSDDLYHFAPLLFRDSSAK